MMFIRFIRCLYIIYTQSRDHIVDVSKSDVQIIIPGAHPLRGLVRDAAAPEDVADVSEALLLAGDDVRVAVGAEVGFAVEDVLLFGSSGSP